MEIKISYTKWNDDFSEAKNKAKDLATGEWLLFLDCSDVFQNGILLREAIVKNNLIADYLFLNTFALAEDGVETHLRHARIIRNKPEYKYVKKVHEDIVLSLKKHNARVASTDLVIRHTGYEVPGSVYRRNRRNYRIQKRWVENNPDADSLDYFHLIQTYILLHGKTRNKKWLHKALRTTDRCLALPLKTDDPLWPKMVFQKGRIYHELDELDKAKQFYQQTIDKRNYIESYLGKAEVLVAERNFEAALGYLTKMLEIGSKDGFEITSVPKNLKEMEEGMFYNLGVCYFNLERYKEAKRAFQQCLMMNNRRLAAIEFLTECLRREGNYQMAFDVSLTAINMFPRYVNGLVNCAGYEIQNKRYVTAKMFLKEALRLNPRHPVARKNWRRLTKR